MWFDRGCVVKLYGVGHRYGTMLCSDPSLCLNHLSFCLGFYVSKIVSHYNCGDHGNDDCVRDADHDANSDFHQCGDCDCDGDYDAGDHDDDADDHDDDADDHDAGDHHDVVIMMMTRR